MAHRFLARVAALGVIGVAVTLVDLALLQTAWSMPLRLCKQDSTQCWSLKQRMQMKPGSAQHRHWWACTACTLRMVCCAVA